jgi:hypothetical protein
MKDRIDIYVAQVGKDGGAVSKTLPTLPTFEAVPCMIQPALSEVKLDYGRHNLTVSQSIFLLNSAAFSAVGLEDRIVADSVRYVVKGKQDLSGLGRVFRIDVIEETK